MSSVSPMTEHKQSKSFDDIWELIRKMNLIAGVFLFPGITKNVWLKRILMLNAPTSLGIVLILAYGTFELNNYSLMSHILVHSILINFATCFFGFWCVKRNNPAMIGFMEWCRSLYKYHEKFHPVLHQIAKSRIDWVHKWGLRVIQIPAFFWWLDAFLISVGFAFIGQFLPESIYPKYSAPLPYYFPFKDQKNWKSFSITLVSQLKCSFDLASFHMLMLCILYTISIHLYTYLNIVKETVELMREKLQARHDHGMKEVNQGQKLNGNSTHDPIIDGSSGSEHESEDLALKEWIKLTVDMIVEGNQILSSFSEIFNEYFFLFELTSFGALFVFGMVMLVLHQQYFFAFGVGCASGIFFSFCFINEQLLEKFTQISIALYDIPWYTLTPKERKLFVQVMTCSNIQRGFKASGIHGVTFERFNKVVQAAYSNVLVLKDLVMKF